MPRIALILLGPPGAGKGTQGRILSAELDFPSISTGDMLRDAARDRTDLGRQAEQYMGQGLLVPDSLVDAIVRARLARDDCRRGFILDGYPRTAGQAEFLQKEYAAEGIRFLAVGVQVPDEALVRRLTGRRNCPNCGRIFHLEANPSRKGDLCDECGAALVQRKDDTVDVVTERLRVYHESTKPLIDYFRARGWYVEIRGEGAVDGIYRELRRVIQPHVQGSSA
jgi:adenylate kinase